MKRKKRSLDAKLLNGRNKKQSRITDFDRGVDAEGFPDQEKRKA